MVLSVRQTAHSTLNVSDSGFLISSTSLGVWCVTGTDDSKESTFPMFGISEIKVTERECFEWKAVTAGRETILDDCSECSD